MKRAKCFIYQTSLVGVPQQSKFGGSAAEFGGSSECDIAEHATSLNKKNVNDMQIEHALSFSEHDRL
jgi:hypothetical protein